MTATFTEQQITAAIDDYRNHHELADDREVFVSRNYQGADIIGFRLSTGQDGNDERFGEWK